MTYYNRLFAALRIYLGLFWLIYGTSKLDSFWLRANGQFRETIADMATHTSGPYHDFVQAIVLPHALLFAYLIAVGETLCGISLTLGLLTRIGAAGGMFLSLNYWLAGGQYSHGRWSVISLEAIIFFISLLVLVLPTNSVWSLDALVKRLRRRR